MTEEEIKNMEEDEILDQQTENENTVVGGSVVNETPETPEEEEEQDPLEKALVEIEQLKTQMLYKTAEFDNYRKRTLKEKAELILNGGEKAVSAILPIIDDMERAMQYNQKAEAELSVVVEGEGVTFAPYVRITSRRKGFCS